MIEIGRGLTKSGRDRKNFRARFDCNAIVKPSSLNPRSTTGLLTCAKTYSSYYNHLSYPSGASNTKCKLLTSCTMIEFNFILESVTFKWQYTIFFPIRVPE